MLCGMRLVGAVILFGLGVAGQIEIFVALMIFLFLTDWLDGKLAILWKQRTTFGARLDSIADFTFYSALLWGAIWLKWGVLRGEWPWLTVAAVSYAGSLVWGWFKFGRLPSYHTRAAKTCWLLIGIASILLFAGWPLWPLRIALAAVTVTNVEAIAITCVLPTWRANVTSLYHAWRDRAKPAP